MLALKLAKKIIKHSKITKMVNLSARRRGWLLLLLAAALALPWPIAAAAGGGSAMVRFARK